MLKVLTVAKSPRRTHSGAMDRVRPISAQAGGPATAARVLPPTKCPIPSTSLGLESGFLRAHLTIPDVKITVTTLARQISAVQKLLRRRRRLRLQRLPHCLPRADTIEPAKSVSVSSLRLDGICQAQTGASLPVSCHGPLPVPWLRHMVEVNLQSPRR